LIVVFEGSENGFAEESIGQHAAGEDVDHGADPKRERMFPGKLNCS
jgi:hypothetical protein